MAFQLFDFLTTEPEIQLSLVDSPNRHVIKHLVHTRFRPQRPLTDREGPLWPFSWESEPSLESFQRALRHLERGSRPLQKFLRLPPSTGITPEASPLLILSSTDHPQISEEMAESGSSDPLNPSNLPNKEVIPEIGESSRAAGKQRMRADTAEYVAAQVETITGVKKNSGSSNYTKNNYTRDCLAILLLAGRAAREEPGYDMPFVQGSINNTDIGAAQAVYRLLSEAKRKTLQTEIEQQLLSSGTPSFILKDRDTFQAWISRIREGPGEPGSLDLSPEMIDDLASRRPSPELRPQVQTRLQPRALNFAQEKQQRRTRSRRDSLDRNAQDPWDREVEEGLARNLAGARKHTPFLPQPEPRPEAFGDQRRNLFQERRRNVQEYRRNSEPQGSPDFRRPVAEDNELAFLRARVAQQEAELRRSRLPEPDPEPRRSRFPEPDPEPRRSRFPDPGPEFVPRENRRLESLAGHRNERQEYNPIPVEYAPEERRPRNLRPNEIMMFDPQKQSAAFFIRRFRHIAELEGSGPVLRILPMCLENDALEWHNGLSSRVRQEMNHDLSVWEDELLREYRPNRFESLKKAENMRFRFDDSSTTLSQYLTRKTNHLHDAGIQDEDMIVRYLWQGLEANLALATPMREEGDTIEAFNRRVRNNETAAKRVYDLNKPRTKAQPVAAATNPARVQRLFGNLAAKGFAQAAETKPKPKAKAQSKEVKPKKPLEPSKTKANVRPKRTPPRPCRHCGGDHWDNDCTDSKKVLKIEPDDPDEMEIDEDEENEDDELDPYDAETYAALEALAEEEVMQGEIPQDP